MTPPQQGAAPSEHSVRLFVAASEDYQVRIERMQLAIDDMVSIACRPHDLPDHYSHETRLAALVVKFIEAAMRHEHLASPEARRGECPIVVIDG